MSSINPTRPIRTQTSENCPNCRKPHFLYTFPCAHKSCADCIATRSFCNLKSFSSLLEADIHSLTNKYSYLGCLQNCDLSKQSLSKSELLEIVKNSGNLDEGNKREFSKLLDLSLGFFFGVGTQFFKCFKCNKVRGNIGLRPLVCSKCICRLYKEQTNGVAKGAIFEFVLPEEVFELRNDFISDFVLVKCFGNKTYECFHVTGSIHTIELAKFSERDVSVVLLRGIIIERSDNCITVEDIDNTVQFVSKVRLIIN